MLSFACCCNLCFTFYYLSISSAHFDCPQVPFDSIHVYCIDLKIIKYNLLSLPSNLHILIKSLVILSSEKEFGGMDEAG